MREFRAAGQSEAAKTETNADFYFVSQKPAVASQSELARESGYYSTDVEWPALVEKAWTKEQREALFWPSIGWRLQGFFIGVSLTVGLYLLFGPQT